MLAEDGESLADVGDVGVGVGLIGVAEDAGGLPVEGGGKEPVAEIGLRATAGTKVVRGASDRDRDVAGLVGGEQLAGHPAAELPLLGVRCVVARFGQGPSGRTAVHVDVLHADQPGAMRLRGGEHSGLEARPVLQPA